MPRTIPRLAIVAALSLAIGAGAFSATTPAAAATTTIAVGDLYFCSSGFGGGVCETTVTAGDTVVWNFGSAAVPHTTTGPFWDSDIVNPGGTFQVTFSDVGSYAYRCIVHPEDMQGVIIVQEPAAQPTATPDGATPAPGAPTATPSDGVAGVPGTGTGPDASSSSSWWLIAAIGAAGASLTAAGAFAMRKQRGEAAD